MDGRSRIEVTTITALSLVIIGCFAAISWYYWQNYNKDKKTMEKNIPVASATVSLPSPSSSPALSIGDLKVEVLNGSGIPGQAGKVAKELEALGFQNVEAGNAPNAEGKQTTLEIKDSVNSDIKQKVMGALNKDFKNIASESATPAALFDITITTGK